MSPRRRTVDDLYEEEYGWLNEATPEEWDAAHKSALDKQIGGSHYKDCGIEPIEFIMANNLGYCEGNIVKYITRHAAKGGVEDIDKVIHYCELLKELKYDET